MTYVEIINEINKKIFRPIYFLHGAEPYFIDMIALHIANSVLSPTEREFNQTIVYGRDMKNTAVGDLISVLKSFPMMNNYQVVILKEAQDMLTKDLDILAHYIENPQPTSIFVICYRKNLEKKWEKVFAKNPKNIVSFNSVGKKDSEIPSWIVSYLQNKKVVCSLQIAQILASTLGNDLSKIANELDKLAINIHKGGSVTMEDVENNIGISKKYNIFELQKAIATNKKAQAIEIAINFSSNTKDNPLPVLIGILNNFFEKLFVYLQIRSSKSSSDIAREMGVKEFFLNDYNIASKYYNLAKVLEVFKLLKEYDMKSKGVGSVAPESELIKEMVFKIISV